MNHQSKQLIAIIFVFVAVLLTTSALAISLSLEEVQFNIDTQNLDWTASENSISDLSDAEYDNLRSLKLPDDYLEPEEVPNLDPLPFGDRDSWDWRDHNGVTAVKHQGGCGSCWAFASTGVVESFILIYDGLNWDLSEQQLVSCNNQGYGCDGGWIYFQPYQYTGGVFESCMPYEASDSVPCTQNQCDKVAYIDSWSEINSSVNSIKNALVDGPVACAMYAFDDLSYYTGGCYSHGYASSVNHGVIIVGYNDNDCSGDGAWSLQLSSETSWTPPIAIFH